MSVWDLTSIYGYFEVDITTHTFRSCFCTHLGLPKSSSPTMQISLQPPFLMPWSTTFSQNGSRFLVSRLSVILHHFREWLRGPEFVRVFALNQLTRCWLFQKAQTVKTIQTKKSQELEHSKSFSIFLYITNPQQLCVLCPKNLATTLLYCSEELNTETLEWPQKSKTFRRQSKGLQCRSLQAVQLKFGLDFGTLLIWPGV